MMWIPAYNSLATHRKTGRFRRKMGLTVPEAVGHLILVWQWCTHNAPSGVLRDVDAEDLAAGAYWEGEAQTLLDALVYAGFIEQTSSGLVLHDWEDYAGKLLAQRATDADRKRKERAAARLLTEPETDPANAGLPERTETNEPEHFSQADQADERAFMAFFDTFWRVYPYRTTPGGTKVKGSKSKAQARLRRLQVAKRGDMIRAARNLAESGQIPKDAERFVANCETKDADWLAWIDPPKGKPAANGHRPGRSEAQPIDADKYRPGGKYGHLFNQGGQV